MWVDNTNSAEIATAQLAAFKIGVTIVTFDERDSVLDISRGLKETKARGLIFSPSTLNFDNTKRANEIYTLIPEISSFQLGDNFSCKAFPDLKVLMHTGHKSIRGASKFKENMSYVKKENTLS